MATATTTQKKKEAKPLMNFRLLSGGFDQVDPKYGDIGTGDLRRMVLERRGITDKDGEDAQAELATINGLTRPQLLRELGAYQRFRANADTGYLPVVQSNIDLVKKFGRLRFDSLTENQQRTIERIVEKIVPVDFNEMTIEELRAFAAEEEIDLPKEADTTGKILNVIRSVRRQKNAQAQ